MTSVLYLHCGYPKTATTTIQTWVFPKLQGLDYIGINFQGRQRVPGIEDLIRGVMVPREIPRYSVDYRTNAVHALRRTLANGQGRHLFSLEGLLAQCMEPRVRKGLGSGTSPAVPFNEAFTWVRDIALEAGFDQVKAFVTVRRQRDLLASFFAEAYKDRFSGYAKLNTFDKYIDHLLGDGSLVGASCVDYALLSDELHGVFGESNALVLAYEWLRADPGMFCERLGSFLEVDPGELAARLAAASPENVRRQSSGQPQLKVRRKDGRYWLDAAKRRLLPGTSLGIGRIVGPALAKLKYGPEILAPSAETLSRIDMHYAPSNRRFVAAHPEFSTALGLD